MTDQTIKAGDELNSLQCITLARKVLIETLSDRAVALGGTFHIRVKPYEKCQLVRITDADVTLVFETYLVRESSRKTTFLKQGTRAVSYSRVTGEKTAEMIVWDEQAPIIEHVDLGRVETAAETRARREWEADAHRVGTAKNPLDNASRTADQFAHPRMTKYWS